MINLITSDTFHGDFMAKLVRRLSGVFAGKQPKANYQTISIINFIMKYP